MKTLTSLNKEVRPPCLSVVLSDFAVFFEVRKVNLHFCLGIVGQNEKKEDEVPSHYHPAL